MPIDDPRDGFFYPTLTLIINSYFLAQDKIKVQCDLSGMRENLTLSQTMRIHSCTTVKIFGVLALDTFRATTQRRQNNSDNQNKKEGIYQESIQSSTILEQGH